MEQLYEYLKGQPKEIILFLVYRLMQDGKFSFSELAEMHVKHLEELKKGETERLMELRTKVIELWCGNKKDIGPKLVKLIQEGKDKGWVNTTQEKIDNSKWNNV